MYIQISIFWITFGGKLAWGSGATKPRDQELEVKPLCEPFEFLYQLFENIRNVIFKVKFNVTI